MILLFPLRFGFDVVRIVEDDAAFLE